MLVHKQQNQHRHLDGADHREKKAYGDQQRERNGEHHRRKKNDDKKNDKKITESLATPAAAWPVRLSAMPSDQPIWPEFALCRLFLLLNHG